MKPKVKKNKKTNHWVAYLEKDGRVYSVTDETMKAALQKWYKKFSGELGIKPPG